MKKQHVQLKPEDQSCLENLLNKGNCSGQQYKRVLALLELNRSKTYAEVSKTIAMSDGTISTWARKYQAVGLEMLKDNPRPGRPTLMSGVDRAKITALACSEAPAGDGQWSLRLLAEKVVELEYVESVSHTEVGRILKKTTSNRT